MPLYGKGFIPTSICCSNRLAAKQNMAMSLSWLSGSDVAKYSQPWDFQIILSWEFPAHPTTLNLFQVYFESLISVKIQTVTDMVNLLHCCPCPEPTFFFVFETWSLGWSFMEGRLLPLYSQSHGAPGGHIQNKSEKMQLVQEKKKKKTYLGLLPRAVCNTPFLHAWWKPYCLARENWFACIQTSRFSTKGNVGTFAKDIFKSWGKLISLILEEQINKDD